MSEDNVKPDNVGQPKVVMDNKKVHGKLPYEKISGRDKEMEEILKKHRIDG